MSDVYAKLFLFIIALSEELRIIVLYLYTRVLYGIGLLLLYMSLVFLTVKDK